MKYVTITSGSLGFYDTEIHTTIPSGAYEITDADYTTFFSDQGKYTFEVQDSKAVLVELTTVYFASDYGMTVTSAMSNAATPTGAVKFTSAPTTAQLESAFPSIAGSRTYTLTTNPVAGDTITICGIALTAGTNFSIGADCDVTAANLNTALNSNKDFSVTYGGISGNNTITITEKIPGNQNNPATASYTGTMVVSSGALTSSVWGYKTAYINQQLTALMAAYTPQMEQIIRANSTPHYLKDSFTTLSWMDTGA